MNNRALHRFAAFTAIATFALLGAGGLVTSHGVGMAVPDWPNTFGYNMFFFPFSQWVGGVFYEHSHRLIASGVGLCTTVLAIWLHGRNARRFLRWAGVVLLVLGAATIFAVPARRPDAFVLGLSGFVALAASFVWPRSEPAKPWLRRLGAAAFGAVVLQGVLGGLRVVLFKDQLGIFHATLAQLFFALTCALALFTSRWWEETFGSPRSAAQNSAHTDVEDQVPLTPAEIPSLSVNISKSHGPRESGPYLLPLPGGEGRGEGNFARTGPSNRSIEVCGLKPSGVQASVRLGWLCLGATLLILAQLIVGATMRHQHAGLAIPDFPLAYGKVWPAMDPQSVAHYNQQRIEVVAANPITASQIALQMVHRLMAALILATIAGCAWLACRELGVRHFISRLSLGWLGLIVTQILLGAATIWSNKAADIATAHVLVGALSLTVGSILSIIVLEQVSTARLASRVTLARGVEPTRSFGARPSPVLGIE